MRRAPFEKSKVGFGFPNSCELLSQKGGRAACGHAGLQDPSEIRGVVGPVPHRAIF